MLNIDPNRITNALTLFGAFPKLKPVVQRKVHRLCQVVVVVEPRMVSVWVCDNKLTLSMYRVVHSNAVFFKVRGRHHKRLVSEELTALFKLIAE